MSKNNEFWLVQGRFQTKSEIFGRWKSCIYPTTNWKVRLADIASDGDVTNNEIWLVQVKKFRRKLESWSTRQWIFEMGYSYFLVMLAFVLNWPSQTYVFSNSLTKMRRLAIQTLSLYVYGAYIYLYKHKNLHKHFFKKKQFFTWPHLPKLSLLFLILILLLLSWVRFLPLAYFE